VRSLLDSGALTPEILQAADHEADLLAHPYVGVEHVQLARLRLAGRADERDALLRQLQAGVRRRNRRPRGRNSALRRAGRQTTKTASEAARRREDETGPIDR
jgi:hypothetical protein